MAAPTPSASPHTRFTGQHRGRPISVTVDLLGDPRRAWLSRDGSDPRPADLPARFDLGDGSWVLVEAAGLSVSRCDVVTAGRATPLALDERSAIRRAVAWADRSPLAEGIRVVAFFVAVPALLILGLGQTVLNIGLLGGPLGLIGVDQPVDLPFGPAWWAVVLAIALVVLLGAEEDARKAWRRFLSPETTEAPAGATVGSGAAPALAADRPAGTTWPEARPAWERRLDRASDRIERGVDAVTKVRFTGRHTGHDLEVTFDFFDDPTHARLLVDGEDRGNRAVPARFDLGSGAALEADATEWAVMECAVVVAGGRRHRLRQVNAGTERAHQRFFAAHPGLDRAIAAVGQVVIVVAGVLGILDLYGVAYRIVSRVGGRLIEEIGLSDPTGWPVVGSVLGWLPESIPLPFGITWWQSLLIAAIPALFAFDRDVRRSNDVFRPGGTEGPGAPASRPGAGDPPADTAR